NSRRLYGTNFASITELEDVINASYNALQLSLNKRFSHGFTVLASYTYSKSIDNISLETDNFNGQNPLNLRGDRGLSDFDIRQRFVGSFLYELPSPKSGIARWVAGGWQINGILFAQTGGTFSIASGTDRVFSGTGTQRPDLVGNPNLDTGRSKDELFAKFFDPLAFR